MYKYSYIVNYYYRMLLVYDRLNLIQTSTKKNIWNSTKFCLNTIVFLIWKMIFYIK